MTGSAQGVSLRRLADAGWLTVLPLILNLVSLGANAYIIRSLGEVGYGTIVVAGGLSGAATILANLGLRALYTKAVAGADDATTEHLIAEQLGLRLMLGVLAAVVTMLAALLLYPQDLVLILCAGLQSLSVLVTIGWTVLADVLNARERFSINAVIAFIAGTALTALSVVVVMAGGGPVGVSASYIAGPLISFALLWRTVRGLGLRIRVGVQEGWPRYRAMLHEARALAANDLVTLIHGRAQGVWAPLLFGKALIGVNSAGGLVANRLEMAADSAATAYFPGVAAAHRNGDWPRVRRQVQEMFSLILVATAPLAGVLWYAAPYLAAMLFPGPHQQEAAELCIFVIRVSGCGVPVSGIGIGMRYALQAVGLHAQNAKDQMLGTVVAAIVTVVMALTLGIEGFAASLVVRSLISRWVQSGTFRETFPHFWAGLQWHSIAITACIPLVVLMVGLPQSVEHSLFRALGVGVIAGACYLAAVLSTGLIDMRKRGGNQE